MLQKQFQNYLVKQAAMDGFSVINQKRYDPFDVPEPDYDPLLEIREAPSMDDEQFNKKPPFLAKLFPAWLERFYEDQRAAYRAEYEEWLKEKAIVDGKNSLIYVSNLNKRLAWKNEKAAHESKVKQHNRHIKWIAKGMKKGDPDAICEAFGMSIDTISLPIDFEMYYECEYRPEERVLIADIDFPGIEHYPRVKKVAYIKSAKEFRVTEFPQSYINKSYEDFTYQLVLRILNRLFLVNKEGDWLDRIVLNGYLNTIDDSTGHSIHPCILSVGVSRDDFESIRINRVNPKSWFKQSRGVSAASIARVTPVAPLMQLDRKDSRFVDGYEVVDAIDEGTNLAMMDWQDFENLIRELFEEEFSGPDSEVRITQASRDGGVDAVAFDPDPIRGGKIVIQAKRYTNTVGVSAVRDLYGTMVKEGAIKGILVTTSNYGNEAYEFADGLPLALLNGANLLAMLNKHGHKAYINIQEAREFLNDQQEQ